MKPIHVLLAILAGLAILALVLWGPWSRGDGPGRASEDIGVVGEGMATGVVFDDRNENGVRDEGERGISGVGVSDQRTVTLTDRNGRWVLPGHDEAVYFVIKPRGYRTPLSEDNLPLFYYLHRDLEPLQLQGPTIPRTGPLPESLDFPLIRQEEPDRFEALFLGDPQPRDLEEVNFFAHDVLEELVGTSAAFAVTLGDLTFDAPELYPHINRATGAVGIPFYNTLGNHDANYDGMDTHEHYETWRTFYGPRYYSFDYGPVHFVVLADVIFPDQGTRYIAGLGQRQLDWLESDLSHVPQDKLVVLAMHIPLTPAERTPDFGRLYELLQDRPHTLSFSAHSHTLAHGFLSEEHGWLGAEPHHHVNAGASCGRWWGGARDETNIPHATGSDGTPNGYFVVTFDGREYSMRFKAARKPAEYQMQIQIPDEVGVSDLAATPVLVNVFSSSERSSVQMSVGDSGDWVDLRFEPQIDPLYAMVTERESGQGSSVAHHMWEGRLPAGLSPGGHLVRVRTTDLHGQAFTASRILRVNGGSGGD
jgi:hypothetical protein